MLNRYRSRLRTKTKSLAVSSSFALDQISTPSAAAYSLRKLRGAYTGSAVRVRRSSDNAELDVGFATVSSELIANGDFSAGATNWNLGSGVTVTSGAANAVSAGQIAWQQCNLVQGNTYFFSFDFTCASGSAIRVNNSSVNGASICYVRDGINGLSGKIQGSFVASSATGVFSVEAVAAFFTGKIDNITVKQVSSSALSMDLDVAALAAHVMPNNSNQTTVASGFVTTWYDQSSNSRNATQTASSSQPRLVSAGQPPGHIFGVLAATQGFNGWIPEVIFYASAIANSDRQTLEMSQGQYYNIAVA